MNTLTNALTLLLLSALLPVMACAQTAAVDDGEGDAAKFHPMVAAQHYRYLLRELVTIRDGERRNSDPEMVRRILPYSAGDIDAVADFMSQLAPPKR